MRTGKLIVPAVVATALLAGNAVAAPGAGSDGLGDPYYPKDGNGGYDVTHYGLVFGYDPPSKQLTGDATISARAGKNLAAFNLDLYKLTVNAVTVDGKPAKWSRSGEHELTVKPAAALRAGKPFTVRVRYSGVPQAIEDPSLGANGWQFGRGGAAFAAGEPHGAATWYPVNDSPLDKASYTFTGTLPTGWSMIANGVDKGTTTSPGHITSHWQADTPMASYLATVSIDKWTFERGRLADGTPLVDAYAPGTPASTKKAEHQLPAILNFLSTKFGKYPQAAAGGIFIGTSVGFSLETQTRPTYSNDMGDVDTIVHENAHQWWGDSVSIKQWKDICLNECFASYAPWLWNEHNGTDLNKLYDQKLDEYRNNAGFWAQKLYDMGPGNEFTGVYDKGPLALHALRLAIGDKTFATVLHDWPAKHRDGNASWPEFEQYVQQLSGKDLRGFFTAWFHAATIPPEKYLHPRR